MTKQCSSESPEKEVKTGWLQGNLITEGIGEYFSNNRTPKRKWKEKLPGD